jgi:hypothetical protein
MGCSLGFKKLAIARSLLTLLDHERPSSNGFQPAPSEKEPQLTGSRPRDRQKVSQKLDFGRVAEESEIQPAYNVLPTRSNLNWSYC